MTAPTVRCLYLTIGYLIQLAIITDSTAIDNGVEGEPVINCGDDRVSVWVKTRKPFGGKIYVKGEYNNPLCGSNYGAGSDVPSTGPTRTTTSSYGNPPSGTTLNSQCPPCPTCQQDLGAQTGATNKPSSGHDPNMGHLVVQMGTCNAKRERQLNPRGVAVQFTVVVSFHQHFITKVDRAYQVRCFYMEADKTVTSELDVSMPQTTEISAQAPMPICTYTIRRGSADGPEVKYTKIGDSVYHVWNCVGESKDMFGMLVHTCTVNDGAGQKVQVLDVKGCSIDKYVVKDLTYGPGLSASVESHVFKFADRALLDFQCSISICVKNGGGCDGVTPPVCPKRERRATLVRNGTNSPDALINSRPDQWDLHAQRLVVVDLDDDINTEQLQKFEAKLFYDADGSSAQPQTSELRRDATAASNSRVCLSVISFGLLIAICTFLFTIAAVIIGSIYVLRVCNKS